MKTLLVLALAGLCGNGLADVAKNPTCRYVQRTLRKLAHSTAEHPAHVRVLFYGQSIVAQGWNARIMADWQRRYPTAKIECRNPAIGGFTSPVLRRTAYSDIYPYYPDILFFHVYGPLDKYEEIVRTTREKTTAEIVLWSSHLEAKDDPKKMLAERDARTRGIEEIARRYHCMYVDLNHKWAKYLVEKGLEPKALLKDTIHLKRETGAFDLYADFLNEEIAPCADTPIDGTSGTITTMAADDPRVKRNADGSLELTFDGNRVVGLASTPGTAKVLLDGKPVEAWPEMWCTTRPSPSPVWMPAIFRVQWKTCPVREDWTLTYLPTSDPDANPIRFTLSGSVSGDCGTGDTTRDLLAPNGRVFVERGDFGVGQYKQFKRKVKPGQTVTWKSLPMFDLPCAASAKGEALVLAQGCPNGRHVLKVIPDKDAPLAFSAFVIHRPCPTGEVLKSSLEPCAQATDVGVCAHVTRHEFAVRNRAFALMRDAGIGDVRCDFEWKTAQKEIGGPFDWRTLDTVVGDAAKCGLRVLPILYGPPTWAMPVQRHVAAWRAFVCATATHFKGRISAYEIWNEQNHPGFWKNPCAADYVPVLKAAYEEIKAVDPSARVVIGGTAGCDFAYFEGVYKAGGKPYFDVMNCHPYCWPNPPNDWLEGTFRQLRDLMARYGDAAKPIWVSEIGWPTQKTNIPTPDVLRAGLRLARPDQADWRIGCVGATDDLAALDTVVSGIRQLVSSNSVVRPFAADGLNAALSRNELDAVVYPFDDSYPLKTIDAVAAFVKAGGVLVDFGMRPMFFPRVDGRLVERSKEGALLRDKAAASFRLDVYGPSAANGLRNCQRCLATDVARKAGLKYDPEGVRVSRFFSARNLKGGDTLIPLLTARGTNGLDAVGGCVIRYGSDMRGAVVLTGSAEKRVGSSEAQQAENCLALLALAEKCGIEKVFFYEFQARERDPFFSEDHFGIVHRDLSPKPAYARLAARPRNAAQRPAQ